MQDELDLLKSYRNNITESNAKELDELISRLKDELPESYKARLSVLKFYELVEDKNIIDDLPF